MSKSDYLENALLNLVFSRASILVPATLHIALYTAAPSDAGGGTEVSTGGGSNYSRAAATNNSTVWPAAFQGTKSNGQAINFPTPSTSWGTVTHVGVFDQSSGGNLLRWAALTIPKTINIGDTVTFPSSSLVFTED